MGSAKVYSANPQTPMAEDKKTITKIFKDFRGLFKKDKKKEKKFEEAQRKYEEPKLTVSVQDVLETFKKLDIKKKTAEEFEKESVDDFDKEIVDKSEKSSVTDEFDHFTCSVVEEERRSERIDSHSSEDSGFADDKKDLADDLKNLKLDDENESKDDGQKKKKVQTVHITRGPVKNKVDYAGAARPYPVGTDGSCRQIHQVNKQILSGGQVIENPTRIQPTGNLSEIEIALKQVQQTTQQSQNENGQEWLFAAVDEIIGKEQEPQINLNDFVQNHEVPNFNYNIHIPTAPTPNPIEEFTNINYLNDENDIVDFNSYEDVLTTISKDFAEYNKSSELQDFNKSSNQFTDFTKSPNAFADISKSPNQLSDFSKSPNQLSDFSKSPNQLSDFSKSPNQLSDFSKSPNAFVDLSKSPSAYTDYKNDYVEYNKSFPYPTPPHSEDVASPMSDSQASMYRQSDCSLIDTLSPERSSPVYNSDCEVFQEIAPVDFDFEYPVSVAGNGKVEKPEVKETARERTTSTGSIKKHMKQYKDLQKEISNSFSKKDCCQVRKGCKLIFQEYMQRVKREERMSLCYKVAEMDLKSAYGVLHHILMSLSQGSEMEDLQHALFCLVCEKVLGQNAALFVGDFGLNLLAAAALRCHRRPLFTRYLVQCVRAAIQNDPSLLADRESVFHEVDAQGDTLLIACARAGDSHADVLYELTTAKDGERPLFRLEHVNADGLSALHVACSEHSPSASKMHTVHVLLEHAKADIWKGNMKSGDTALHLVVNSKTCDLHLVMLIFRHVDRKSWKKLAHLPNMCSKTPLEYAREATRSPLRQNHPYEVFEFLKKCRN